MLNGALILPLLDNSGLNVHYQNQVEELAYTVQSGIDADSDILPSQDRIIALDHRYRAASTLNIFFVLAGIAAFIGAVFLRDKKSENEFDEEWEEDDWDDDD